LVVGAGDDGSEVVVGVPAVDGCGSALPVDAVDAEEAEVAVEVGTCTGVGGGAGGEGVLGGD